MCVAFSFLAFCLLLTKRVFLLCRCCDLADVDGGRLQLYQSVPFDRYQIVREERRREAFAKVEKQKMEEQRLLAVVNKWENVDRSKAAVALKALDKLWPEMEAAEETPQQTPIPQTPQTPVLQNSISKTPKPAGRPALGALGATGLNSMR